MTRIAKLILQVTLFLLLQERINAQCPSVTLNAVNSNCLGSASLTLVGAKNALQITWYRDGIALNTVSGRVYASSGTTVAGGNGPGAAPNQLNNPLGVYVDAAGNVYVADHYNNRIQKWAPGASSGITVAGGNGQGAASNQFNWPEDVWVDKDGNIFVADTYNNRIQKWAPGASSGTTVAGGNGGGPGANQLSAPEGVQVDSLGNIYVADQGNDRIQKWAPGAVSGISVAGGNGKGSAPNQLNTPRSMYVDVAGNIYVADNNNRRIQKWAPGASSGVTVAGGNGAGFGANQFYYADAVFVDLPGNIFVVDDARIQKWTPGATSGTTVAGTGHGGPEANKFSGPTDIYIDAAGNFFIADEYNRRIQKWAATTVPVDTNYNPTSAGSYMAVVTYPDGCRDTSNAIIIAATMPPVISNFSPQKAGAGSSVTITGTNFTGATAVSFGGLPASSFKVVNNNTIIAVVNSGSSGTVSVTTTVCSGTASLGGFEYCTIPAPVIGITSSIVCAGDTLRLSGADSAVKIAWYKNGTLVNTVNRNNNGYANSGSTVAGSPGPGDTTASKLNSPLSVSVDNAGNVYVADANNFRIQKWAPGATQGITVAGGRGYGTAANQLKRPHGICLDGAGNLFIADKENHRIQKWAPGATQGVTVAGGNGSGAAANQLSYPTDVFVDSAGNIFIADYSNHRIQKWLPGAVSGITIAGGNGWGTAANQVTFPHSICLDSYGNVFVADSLRNGLSKWAPGADSGTTLAVGRAAAVFVDVAGNIFIADQYNSRIQKIAADGSGSVVVAGGNGYGTAANQLSYPFDVFVGGAGDVYIADTYNNRIQKWAMTSLLIDTSYVPATAGSYTAVVTYPDGCTATSNAVLITDTTRPVINGFFPKKTGPGATVTITGSHFSNVTAVSFGGLPPASYTVINSDTIVAVLGAGTSGSVSVSTRCGGIASLGGFMFCNLPAPTINNSSICLSDTLRLTGADSALQIKWYQNGTVQPADTNSIIIPKLAGSYKAIITLPGGCIDTTGTALVFDTVAPVITNFYPKKAAPGTTVTIIGAHFTEATAVSFGGAMAASFTFLSDTMLTAVTGAGAGNIIMVTTACGGSGSSGGFEYCSVNAPVLSIASPCFGDTLRLKGAGSAEKIEWYKDGVIVKSTVAGYSSSGVTVAGGNGFGTNGNQVPTPAALFIDSAGNIFITDRYYSRILKWAPGATSGSVVAGGFGVGAAANQLEQPYGLSVDKAGNIFIADYFNHRIQKWLPGATTGIRVAGVDGYSAAANGLFYPQDVHVDVLGNMFIVDRWNHRIQKWAQGADSGITIAGGNGQGAAANQLNAPTALFVDQAGNVFIADSYNHRIQKWAPGATSGITVAGGNNAGTYASQLNFPSGVYVDVNGNIFIADQNNLRIQKWTPGATSGITVAGGRGQGSASYQLDYPKDVYLDASGNIFVADGNDRIQKWAAVPADTSFRPTSPGSFKAVVTYLGGCTVTSNVVAVTSCSYWTGAVNSNWNEPGNWSTGMVPDANTAVLINSGTVVVTANAVCYSLSVASGVNFTVNPGIHLTVWH